MAFPRHRRTGASLVAVALGTFTICVARADDSKSVRSLDLEPPRSDQAFKDPATTVDDFERQRAAVEAKSKSPVSLSVSGWVSQQFEVTRGK